MKATLRTFDCKNNQYHGDCIFLVLRNEESGESFHIMIDCGALSKEIKDYIRINLNLRLDLVIATHIDGDHIDGITAILNDTELKDLTIGKILFNCYQPADILDSIVLPLEVNNRLNSLQGAYKTPWNSKISAPTAVSLTAKILSDERLKSVWHTSLITKDTKDLPLGNQWGKLIFLSPTTEALQDLDKLFRKVYAGRTGLKFPDKYFDNIEQTYELLIKLEQQRKRFFKGKWISRKRSKISEEELQRAVIEKVNEKSLSEANKASLAFIWEANDHRILFLGDAMAKVVFESLDKKYNGQSLRFDAIKVSHHGSKYNTTTDLMKKIDAPVFFLTGGYNLSEDCPTLEAIAKIILRAPVNEENRLIRYNFSNDNIKRLSAPVNKDIRDKYKFEMIDEKTSLPYEFEY